MRVKLIKNKLMLIELELKVNKYLNKISPKLSQKIDDKLYYNYKKTLEEIKDII